MKKIVIPYFPTGVKFATPIAIGLGVYLWIIGYPIWFGVLALLTLVVLTTNYVTEIDTEKKTYRDFVSVLWLRVEEETVKFDRLTKIVISKERNSQIDKNRGSTGISKFESGFVKVFCHIQISAKAIVALIIMGSEFCYHQDSKCGNKR